MNSSNLLPATLHWTSNMKNAFEYETELAALREELAIVTGQKETWLEVSKKASRNASEAEERLADAERRNADYEFSLMYLRSQIDNSVLVAYIDAALTKPEEAKS